MKPPRPLAADPRSWENFVEEIMVMIELQEAIGEDFNHAEDTALKYRAPHLRRNLVRCFGSFVDAMSATLREMAWKMSIILEQPLNPFLKEKTSERGITTIFRITTTYRIVGELMPKSPYANVDQSRWDRLQRAIEIRNRVMHPENLDDLKVTEEDVLLMSDITTVMMKDLVGLAALIHMKQEETVWKLGARRERIHDKVHRNDLCVCRSGKKYKHCCGRSTK